MATIATQHGSKASQAHNRRDEKVVSKEEHIDPNGHKEVWIDEDVRDAYHRIFDGAKDEYNAKQKRADRKIDDYYKHVKNNDNQNVMYEMVIGVYGQNDKATCRTIMKEFVDGWKERNPNLEIIGAYYHADEKGEPHCHIDYIPKATGYQRGMSMQAGLAKAYEQMGFKTENPKHTGQMKWEARENAHLERICGKYGIKVEHPHEGLQHLHTKVYKEIMMVKDRVVEASITNYQHNFEKLKTTIYEMKMDIGVENIRNTPLEPLFDRLERSCNDITRSLEYSIDDAINRAIEEVWDIEM